MVKSTPDDLVASLKRIDEEGDSANTTTGTAATHKIAPNPASTVRQAGKQLTEVDECATALEQWFSEWFVQALPKRGFRMGLS
ncbi:MAG: hypothetical protein IID41_13195 [Planctomycetes bacterium]|nr:hypothetical protein [Planctomycetota bacterium]